MNAFLLDLKHAARSLSKSPSFTAIAVLTLALGIGVNTAVFSVADAVLFRPLAFARPEELVRIYDTNPSRGIPRFSSSPPNFVDWREQSRSFSGMAAYTETSATLLGGDAPESLTAYQVSPALFPVIGVAPLLGRTFEPADEKPGRPPSVVLSWELWQRRFGGDRGIVGKTIRLDEVHTDAAGAGQAGPPSTVIGVMPRGFRFPNPSTDVWLPLVLDAQALENRGAHWVSVIARRKAGISLQEAQADLGAIAARLEAAYPAKNAGWNAELVALSDAIAGSARRPLILLLASVGFVLLIACVNVANLLLARGVARRREVAIRAALGASRARIVRQLLAESLLLAAAGGVVGAVVAIWGCDALIALGGASLPRSAEAGVDGRALLFTMTISLAAAVLAGLWPAFRSSAAEDGQSLREAAGRGSASRRTVTARRVLLATEVAVTLLLLAGAALLLRSLGAALRVNPGFRPDGVLTAQLVLPSSRYDNDDKTAAFSRELLSRLGRLPGVTAVATTNILPMSGGNWWMYSVQIPEHPVPEGDEISLAYRTVGGDFFGASGVVVKRGRRFTNQDRAGSPLVAILNETAARRCFPGQDPIGREIVIGDRTKAPRRIIGVVGDVLEESPVDPPAGGIYVPAEQKPWSDVSVLVRTTGDPLRLAPMLRAEVRALDPQLPVDGVGLLADQVSRALKARRFTLTLLGAFAALALLLAAVGTYGVAACAAAERTREIGIRVALGARRADVVALFLGDGARVAGAGLLAGLLLAVPSTQLLRSFLFGVNVSDPVSFGSVSLLLLASTLGAGLVPALRATRTDPVKALRAD
jgi:putative ABC transport system permease protein